MIPSVKTLESIAVDREGAKRIRAILEDHRPFSGNNSVRHTLESCDQYLKVKSFGMEIIDRGHNLKSPAIRYLNVGDPYKVTLMYVSGSFRVGCWGDIVERGRYD